MKFRKEDAKFKKLKQVRFLFQEPKENMDLQSVLQVQGEREYMGLLLEREDDS